MTENFPLLPGLWEYDRRGQVQAGRRYWADGTVVAGQQYEYGYDDIGNRTKASSGGDGMGTNLRTAVSSSSLVNQLGSRQVPATVDVIGVARGTVSVGVDAQSPVTAGYRKGEYFRQEVTARASDAAAAYAAITVQVTTNGSGGTAGPFPLTQTGRVFVPVKNEVYSYDADGNLTQDGRWTYSWDGENRLTNMVSMALPNNPPAGTPMRVSFRYDAQGRRIYKGVFTSTTSTTPAVEEKYVYDGWNLIAVLNGGGALQRRFVWGPDLSGSLQGAGGVGGLVAVVEAGGANAGGYFPAYDGNGNVAALVSAASSAVSAVYEYGPFGEVIRCSGPLAKANPFRFSTKFQDDETDLLYYGYRFYNASSGRWPNRDPIQERGGINLYAAFANYPIGVVDAYGLKTWKVGKCEILVVYGHGHQTKPPHDFKFGGACSAGHFVGCYSRNVNGGIEEGHTVPGAPSTDEELLTGPGSSADPDNSYAKHIADTQKAAEELAKEMCKSGKCECKEIKITFRFGDPGGWANPLNWGQSAYGDRSSTVKCDPK